MALTKCKECGNEISDQALICPHCGGHTKAWELARQNKKIRTRKIWFNIFSVVLIFVLVGIACGSRDSINCLVGRWESSGELEWKYVWEVLGCIFAFGLSCFSFTIKRPRIFKVISSSLFCLYVTVTLAYIAKSYINDVRPTQQFRSTYCNTNVLNALKDAKLVWGEDVEISFYDNIAVFAGAINKTEFPIDSVSNKGEIYISCTVIELKKMFGDKLNDYFYFIKETARSYLDNKGEHYFSISPNCNSLNFSILYLGYFANYPRTTYKPSYGHYSNYGTIADGIDISSVDYEEAGWFRLQAFGDASIITLEY